MNASPIRLRKPLRSGFSLIELLLVAALGAVVFTSAAVAFRAIAGNQRTPGSWQRVHVAGAVAENFFGLSESTSIDSYVAPNFGRCALADRLRTRFLEDVDKSVAVFMLPRGTNINTFRPTVISTVEKSGTVITSRVLPSSLDTPAAFLSYLASRSDYSAAASVFLSYRGAPPDTAAFTTTNGSGTTVTTTHQITNATVFLMAPSGSNEEMWVRAIYEIDYINVPAAGTANSPDVPCVLGSVRRYVGTTLTHYYDVVFRNSIIEQAGIPCVHFEKQTRASVTEASSIQAFKAAGNQPFYMLWWPDPGISGLKGSASVTYSGPRAEYAKHEGQSSYMFVVPQFPAL
jgi:prepilin-type N-terminal cleavage/methylation domain-containing protein